MHVCFEWDEKKRHANLSKHGIDFLEAAEMFQSPILVVADNREDYGEDRLIGVGLSKGRVLVVVFTEPQPDIIRVISLRKATRNEQAQFRERIKD
ncbi:MAG: BrnT family toxin [Deltaproteobacteria bacterium]|nr:BrnT family toxin [Deltaproteobacteria bacterium]